MSGKVFFSYRHEDEPGFALALYSRLDQTFPSERLLMDIEGGTAAGQDFVQVLQDRVSACDAMLVLIGPKWLTATDEMGRRRLDDPQDFVRVEVESALRLGKRFIPVLVNKTEMPRAEALPGPIRPLAWNQALGLTRERLNADAQGVMKAVQRALEEAEAARQRAAAEAAAAEKRRAAELAAKAEMAARAEKERARLESVAGLSPEHRSSSINTIAARAPFGDSSRNPRRAEASTVWPRAAHSTASTSAFAIQAAATLEAHKRQMRERAELVPASAPGKRRLGALQRLWRRAPPDGS
jgi:hypothetical protein